MTLFDGGSGRLAQWNSRRRGVAVRFLDPAVIWPVISLIGAASSTTFFIGAYVGLEQGSYERLELRQSIAVMEERIAATARRLEDRSADNARRLARIEELLERQAGMRDN